MLLMELTAMLEAGWITVFFEDGEFETYTCTEQETMIEQYGGLYVTRITPYTGGVELQLSNQNPDTHRRTRKRGREGNEKHDD